MSPCDALVKCGPLRARGWGSAPDALLNAPRFGTLVQVVWFGSDDNSDFGFDPVLPAKDLSTAGGARGYLSWITRVTRYGEISGAVSGDSTSTDDLRFLQNLRQARETRTATLVQIEGEQAILYPPFFSRV